MRYPALIDGEDGAYGVVLPDLLGCVAMGYTIDDALSNAVEALRDYVFEMEQDGTPIPPPSRLEDVKVPNGSALASVVLIPGPSKCPNVKVSMTLNADVADVIKSEAKRRKMSRGEYVEWMVHAVAKMGA